MAHTRRRTWLPIAAAALAAAAGAALLVARRERGPVPTDVARRNVLLITLDTTRADRLGCYGYAGARTQRLDRLAREGVRFEHAFADAPITLPSHASLFTALHPFRHGVRNNGNFYLPDRFETLATVLRGRGYRTAAFVSSFVLDRRYGLARGFETYDDRTGDPGAEAVGIEAERRGDETALACARWLDAHASRAPFFVWLHLYDPHEPYEPPPPFGETFAGRPYDGEIAFADAALGSVLDRLQQRQALDRTVVAAVGDHGEGLGDHGEETHSMFLYEATIRVPLILWAPGLVPAGRVVASPVRTVDVAPTLLDLVALPPLTGAQGRSLRAMIDGRDDRSAPVYAETWVPKLYMNGAALRALRTDRYKLIDAPRPELYDVAADPGEARNLHEAEGETARRLRAQLEALSAGGDTTVSAGPMDGDAVEKLQALGYLGAAGGMAPAADGGTGKDPKDLIAAFNRLRAAERAVRDRRFADALPVLRTLVAEEPKNAFARHVLGTAYMGMRQYARALAELRAYAALVPTSAHVHQSMAVAHANLGDEAAALRETAAALDLDPRLVDARLLRAGLLAKSGRRAEAIDELRAAVEAAPDRPLLRLSLAEVLLDSGKAREAEAEYRAVLGQDEDTVPPALVVETRFNLAAALERQGRRAEARAEYERVAGASDAAAPVREAARRRLGLPP